MDIYFPSRRQNVFLVCSQLFVTLKSTFVNHCTDFCYCLGNIITAIVILISSVEGAWDTAAATARLSCVIMWRYVAGRTVNNCAIGYKINRTAFNLWFSCENSARCGYDVLYILKCCDYSVFIWTVFFLILYTCSFLCCAWASFTSTCFIVEIMTATFWIDCIEKGNVGTVLPMCLLSILISRQ